jgi:uroporphyrinogen-III synthase
MAAMNSWRTPSESAGNGAQKTGAEAKKNTALKSAVSARGRGEYSDRLLVDMPAVWLNALRMKSKVVAILETRAGTHLAELVTRRGGVPMLAPALEEVPDVDPRAVLALLDRWRAEPFKICIFQTGVGTKALFAATDAANVTDELKQLLSASMVVVRGPKPVGELNTRNIRIDIRAESPFTTEMVLAALAGIEVKGFSILVQRYGATNQALAAALEARGATVLEIATYRWALPADTQPLVELLQALDHGRVDAVVFTSAVQMHNLYAIAQKVGCAAQLAGHLNRSVVASIGPVCSRTLRDYGVTPTLEASPPKLGPLLTALDAALSAA